MSLLDYRSSELVIAAPGSGEGYWAGGPSAVRHGGWYYLAYRLRRPVAAGRGYANVVARSRDGVRFETLCRIDKGDLATASLERPALVRRPDGGWRLYVSLSTEGSKHWCVAALDADRPEQLATGALRPIWPGDERTAVKDPVVIVDAQGRWHAWLCVHPLDLEGAEDRMSSAYCTSVDGLSWSTPTTVLAPPSAGWDRRGRRLATVLTRPDGSVLALYDGRADATENWYERTGIARADSLEGPFEASPRGEVLSSPHPRHTLRYASAVLTPDGGWRVFFEAAGTTGANEIRTQLLDPASVG